MKMSHNSNRFKKPVSSLKSLDVFFSNIRGLRSNFSSVESFLLQKSPDLLALCETNLKSDICSSDFQVDGYLPLIRKDSASHMLGLGVYVRKNVPVCREFRFESLDHSFMCFRLSFLHSITFLFFLYRSPSSQDCSIIDVVSDSIDHALSLFPTSNICVFGDFNVHHVEWLGSRSSDSAGTHVYNFSLTQSLTQIIDFPTRYPDNSQHSPSLLDLCLVSNPSLFSVSCHSPLGYSDHALISINLELGPKFGIESPYHRTSYNYFQADWDSFRDFLRDGPWNVFFSLPAEDCASKVVSWISAGRDAFIPSRRFQVKPHSSPWFSPACAAAISHRNHYFHQYRRDNSFDNKRLFTAARNRCRKVLNNAKLRYAELTKSRISSQKLGSRDFWKIFNNVFNKGKSTIPPLFHGSDVLTSSKDKAELFATKFSTNTTLNSSFHDLPEFPLRSEHLLRDLQITPKFVARVISRLDPSTASGPDCIPVIVLQKCSPELSSILSKLYNKCITESCFPSCWKSASVVPIFKNSGDRSDPSNYRPISLLPIISKIFEALINDALVSHFESNQLFSDNQYGFRSSRSTADLLTVITERFYRALDGGGEASIIALDISKAFDKVWHAGLLHKLRSYGVSGNVFKVIESFLSNRSLKVVLDGQQSSSQPVSSGVPQGSILGPILFLTYINDLPDNLLSKVAIYADDTSLYSCLDKKSALFDRLQHASNLESDLSSLSDWGSQWLVTFNSKKTKLLSINRYRSSINLPICMSGETLPESHTLRLLGLSFSCDLSWNDYIKSIAKSASMKVGSLYRARSYLSPECILHLYKSLIRPCIEYCCHIWSGASSDVLSLLDRVQRRIINIVGPNLASTLQPLSHRRNVASLALFYKYYHGRCSNELSSLVPSTKVHGRITRRSGKCHPFTVQVPFCKKGFYSRSFFPRTCVLWNSLPLSCFPETYDLQSFKASSNRYLRSFL